LRSSLNFIGPRFLITSSGWCSSFTLLVWAPLWSIFDSAFGSISGPFVGRFQVRLLGVDDESEGKGRPKRGQKLLQEKYGQVPSTSNCFREEYRQVPSTPKLLRGVSGGQFSGLLHFATDRTLSGWTLLFAMGKHTSKEFLYGRKHSRISKRPKTRSKVRSKSGSKTRPGQHPKSKKHPYTGKSSLQRGLKKGPKSSSKMTPKMMDKSTSKIASGAKSTTSPFSKAGID
jgi:hypothetical protein